MLTTSVGWDRVLGIYGYGGCLRVPDFTLGICCFLKGVVFVSWRYTIYITVRKIVMLSH